jgi:hypothetical protein
MTFAEKFVAGGVAVFGLLALAGAAGLVAALWKYVLAG